LRNLPNDLLVERDAEKRSDRLDKFSDEMRQAMGERFRKQAAQEAERRVKAQASREARSAATRKWAAAKAAQAD
jgi:hypothetical protein